MKKKILRIALIALALPLLMVPIRGAYFGQYGGLQITMWLGALLFFIYTTFRLRQYAAEIKPLYIVLAILTGSFLLEFPVMVIGIIKGTVHPLFLVEAFIRVVTIFGAYLVSRNRNIIFKATIISVNIAIILFFVFIGADYVINLRYHGTLTGKIADREIELKIETENGETLVIEDFKGSYLVLDCWYTRCGVCYEGFPRFQELYDRYKDNPRIQIAALHFWDNKEETYGTGSEILRERDYTFECLSVPLDDIALREMVGVAKFPTIIIFSPEGKQVFVGNLEFAEKFLEKNID